MLNKLQKPTFSLHDLSCKPFSITAQSKKDRNQARGTCVQQMFCNLSSSYSCFHSRLTTEPLRSAKFSAKLNSLSRHHIVTHMHIQKNNDWFGFSDEPFICQVWGFLLINTTPSRTVWGSCHLDPMSCLEKVKLVELVEGAPWQSYTNSILSSSCLCSGSLSLSLSLSLSFTSLCLLLSGSFSSSVLVFLLPPFSQFSVSINLPLSSENVVLIRHFAEPVCWPDALENTSNSSWTAFQTFD